MARLQNHPKFVVSGMEESVTVGNTFQVTCIDPIQLFTKDIWDGNATDNVLEIRCRADRGFDVPSDDELPECLAQCDANKPQPPAENNITLDATRTSPTQKLWEREELWYKCDNKLDGIAVPIGSEGKEEGSDSRDIAYICTDTGEYDMPTKQGAFNYPKCLPRRKLIQIDCFTFS